jgi:transcriptional regulator with XRE-family HTH domain
MVAPDAWYRVRSARQLGRAVANCRKRRGLTQADLAARIGVDRTTLLSLEAGRTQALERLVRIVAELGYDVALVPRDAEMWLSTADDGSARRRLPGAGPSGAAIDTGG